MSSVREVFAELGLDVDQNAFAAGEAAMGLLRNGLFAIGAGLTAAAVGLAGIVGTTVKAGSQINDMSQRTGVSTDALQKMGYAAKLNGVDMETLARSMQFLAKKGVKDVQGEMIRLADRFSKMKDGGAKTAEAMKLFGRSGASLIPMLNEGSAGLERMAARAELLGFVMDKDTIKAADDLGDAFDELGMAAKGLVFTIAKPFLKPLTAIVQKTIDWMAANRKLIAGKVHEYLDGLARGLKYVGQILDPFVQMFLYLANNVWVVRAAMLALGLVLLSQLGGAVMSVVGSVFSLLKGLLAIGATGLITSLVVGAGFILLLLAIDEVNTYLKDGDSLLGRYGTNFSNWLDTAFKFESDDPWWLRALKTFNQLLFDITNGDKWRQVLDLFGFKRTGPGSSMDLRDYKIPEGAIGSASYKPPPQVPGWKGTLGRALGFEAVDMDMRNYASPTGEPGFHGPDPMAYGPMTRAEAKTLSAPVTINMGAGQSAEDVGAAVTKHIDNYVGRLWGETYVTVDK